MYLADLEPRHYAGCTFFVKLLCRLGARSRARLGHVFLQKLVGPRVKGLYSALFHKHRFSGDGTRGGGVDSDMFFGKKMFQCSNH